MGGISKTGSKAHDDAVLAAELVLQNALAGTPTQAQANAAHVNHFTTVRDSAIANNLPAVAAYFENARRVLAARGNAPP